MKFQEVIKALGAAREIRPGSNPDIQRISEDSRRVRGGDLFVARGGTKVSGTTFARDAVAAGAVAVVADQAIDLPADIAFALVDDAGLAAALLAHEVAGHPTAGMKMIGVTGTKGKTTVAYLMRSVLKAAGHKVGMIGTVEIDDGKTVAAAEMTTPGAVELVELFCRMRDHGVTHCVMEVSSHALHQHRVAGIDFAVGMFTNLTGDHLDYHKTMEEYAGAKAILFEGLKPGAVAVVNADDAWVTQMVERTRGCVIPYGVIGVQRRGKGLDALWTASIEEMTSDRMELTVRNGVGIAHVETSLVGEHNAYNLLSVITAAGAVGISLETSCQALREARGAPGRLQRVKSERTGFSVFVDYAHTHDALENVLKALRTTMGAGRLICLFGCGGDRDRTKRPKMGAVAEKLADVVIVTSDNPRTEEPGRIIEEICAGFSAGWGEEGKITVEADRRAAIRMAIGMAQAGDVVLLAGKGHENYQIIGTTKHHFDDVEEAEAAMKERGLVTGNLKLETHL